MASQTNRSLVNGFLAVFLVVVAIDVFLPASRPDGGSDGPPGGRLKDKVNTLLVWTGLWQGPWRLYTPADRVNLRFKADVAFADQTTATWTSPDWSRVPALRKFVQARHMNYFGYLLRADEPAWDALCAYLARSVPHPQGKAVAVEQVTLSLRGALIPSPDEVMLPARPYLDFAAWEVLRAWKPPT